MRVRPQRATGGGATCLNSKRARPLQDLGDKNQARILTIDDKKSNLSTL